MLVSTPIMGVRNPVPSLRLAQVPRMLGQALGPSAFLADRRQADAAADRAVGQDLLATEAVASERPNAQLPALDDALVAALLADDPHLEAVAVEIGEGLQWRVGVGHGRRREVRAG